MTVLLANVVLGLFQLVISIIFTVIALYIGFIVMGRLPHNIYLERELANGNTAVGIFVAAVLVSIALVVESGIAGLSMGINKALSIGIFTGDGLLAVAVSLIQLILGIVLAVSAIYIALYILDKLSKGADDFYELKRGNNAVAFKMGSIIIAVAVIIQSGVIGITTSLI